MVTLLARSLLLASIPMLAVTVLACGAARGGGGGGHGVGDDCTPQQADDDAHTCSGTRALECKATDTGDFVWELDKDCADTGARCASGECVADDGGNNGTNNGQTDCPDVAGTWTFEDHCEAVLIGESYDVFQDGCELTVPTPDWTGSIDSDGVVTLSGPIDNGTLTCVGQATERRLEASCSPPCDVVLVR